VPVAPPLPESSALPSRPIEVVPAGKETGITCPAASIESGWPAGTSGQV
jgi:hypothetical protein